MTKQGKMILGLLVLAIVGTLVLFPAPKSAKKTSLAPPAEENMEAIMREREQRAIELGVLPPKSTPPPKKAPPPIATARMAIDPAEFAMMADRYGRNDPFSPFFNIEEFTGELMDLPDLEPLPPMIMQNPPSMRLTAIVLRDGVGTAVVNGEVLYVGDVIAGFTVSEITIDKVILLNELKDKAILRLKQEGMPSFNVNSGSISNIEEGFMQPPSAPPSRLIPMTEHGLIIPDDDLDNEITSRKTVKTAATQMKESIQDDTLIDVEKMLSAQENAPR